MRLFTAHEVRAALAHTWLGHQSLHIHAIIPDRAKAPACFVNAVDRGEPIAHLFDMDTDRLEATARALGVSQVYVHRAGTDRQHVDLCAGPLRRAFLRLSADDADKLAVALAQFRLKRVV